MNALLARYAMIVGVSLILGAAFAAGLTGLAFGLTAVIMLTAGQTAVDVAVTPRDRRTGFWYRRAITLNLGGTAVAAAILVAFVGLPS